MDEKEKVLLLVKEYLAKFHKYYDEDLVFACYWLDQAWREFERAGLDSYRDWPERFPITNPLIASKPAC